MHGEYIIIYIMLDMIFLARYLYIKTQFYKTEGIAYGNSNHYFSEFLIRDDKGYNYVGWVSRNIFSPLHTRGAVYTIYVNKNNPKNAVMGNEPTLYLIPSIVFFVFVIFYLIVLALGLCKCRNWKIIQSLAITRNWTLEQWKDKLKSKRREYN